MDNNIFIVQKYNFNSGDDSVNYINILNIDKPSVNLHTTSSNNREYIYYYFDDRNKIKKHINFPGVIGEIISDYLYSIEISICYNLSTELMYENYLDVFRVFWGGIFSTDHIILEYFNGIYHEPSPIKKIVLIKIKIRLNQFTPHFDFEINCGNIFEIYKTNKNIKLLSKGRRVKLDNFFGCSSFLIINNTIYRDKEHIKNFKNRTNFTNCLKTIDIEHFLEKKGEVTYKKGEVNVNLFGNSMLVQANTSIPRSELITKTEKYIIDKMDNFKLDDILLCFFYPVNNDYCFIELNELLAISKEFKLVNYFINKMVRTKNISKRKK